MSPLVTETSLTWWPLAAHIAAVPPAASSQSSGCAPKQIIRSLPSSGGTDPARPSDVDAASREKIREAFIRFVGLVCIVIIGARMRHAKRFALEPPHLALRI